MAALPPRIWGSKVIRSNFISEPPLASILTCPRGPTPPSQQEVLPRLRAGDNPYERAAEAGREIRCPSGCPQSSDCRALLGPYGRGKGNEIDKSSPGRIFGRPRC